MKRTMSLIFSSVVLLAVVSSCTTGMDRSILSDQRRETPAQQYIWVGEGKYFEYKEGEWVPNESQNYEFLVRQNRFEDRWESLKVQNRTHSEYDGVAGPADQQHFFRVVYGPQNTEGNLTFDLTTTLGHGSGEIDPSFSLARMDFEAQDISSFAPYNRFLISQNYDYPRGTLVETVLLYKRTKDNREIPFAKIEERATLFNSQQD